MSEFKRENQRRRTALVRNFCTQYKFELVELNHGYQLRIEGIVDVYPVRGFWHWLPTNERGSWESINDLRRIMLERLPTAELREQAKAVNEEWLAKRTTKALDLNTGNYPTPRAPQIKWDGVNMVPIHNLDLAESDVPYNGIKFARNRIHRWWLRRKHPGEKIYLRRDMYGKAEYILDPKKSMGRK